MTMELEALIAGLSEARAYPWLDPAAAPAIELCQTHISAVFLVGEEVFKIHKPVDFGFLNFTTLAARREDCEAEVEVNAALAPGVYLGVVAIVADEDGRPRVLRPNPDHPDPDPSPDPSQVLEWAVWMRRLPDSATFEQLLRRGALEPPQLRALASTLASFYAAGEAAAQAHPELARLGDIETVSGNARENFSQLEALIAAAEAAGRPAPMDSALLARVRAATEAELARVRETIHDRHQRGHVRDTHGDLRLDHVYHLPSATAEDRARAEAMLELPGARELLVIDRIEFTDRFRWADPISDLAFLMMDLQARGAWSLAQAFADAFFAASRDHEGAALLSFYTGYRAMVRAKVAAMAAAEAELGERAQQKARAKAEARARLALVELSEPASRPCLILLAGLPGTGKSVLARGLHERAGFEWIRADEVRKQLAGLDPLASAAETVDGGIYSRAWSDRTYAACLERAGAVCLSGGRAIVDATFIDGERRRRFVDSAIAWGIPAHLLVLTAPEALVRERLAARRGDPSDADWAVYLAARERWTPVDPRLCRSDVVDASGSPAQLVDAGLAALARVGLR
ncbi:AAA family ATPase [Pseudenhygromyxa sp. WMMC2535]|uniref:bifunctional aminoglycoside phosphotransferase/ATP-binding protein n=1 Tax=Pseudenhygromyxa sp. WMMC2535 TaxID=2712867 RepID=UPI001556C881|nr:bifunctional aminoglycoside phosphotransferase/ATP-binding protein [Pseudenhygromyxa sp. WMMC2535]NVB38074.1 AAA family ATPase [Pseudenhygromyxa sp. WMMC2535]